MRADTYLLVQELAQATRNLAWAKSHHDRELMTLYERHIIGIEQLLEQRRDYVTHTS